MVVPAPRMLGAAAAIALPLAAIGGMFSSMTGVCAAALVGCAAVAAVDAGAGLRRIAKVALRLPAFLRLTKDVASTFPVTVENRGGEACRLRLGVNLPAGVESEDATREIDAPAG